MNNKNSAKKDNTIKYFFAGIFAAILLVIIYFLIKDDTDAVDSSGPKVWSAETDSSFVKSCYNKYRDQIKDDLTKRELTRSFCRCMLDKIKTKYEESEMNRVADGDIKKWDAECRSGNPF